MKTILVMTDFSEESATATSLALKLAERVEAELWLYQAFEPLNDMLLSSVATIGSPPETPSKTRTTIKDLKKMYEEVLKNKEIDSLISQTCFVRSGIFMVQTEKLLLERNLWVIVSTGKNYGDLRTCFLFGSNTYNMINRTTCPILLVSDGTTTIGDLNKIVFAADLSKTNKEHILYVVEVAKLFNSEIIFIDVHSRGYSLNLNEAYGNIEQLKESVGYKEIKIKILKGGAGLKELAQYCGKQKVDLLVVKFKEKAFFERVFNRSTRPEMIKYRKIPLLIVPVC